MGDGRLREALDKYDRWFRDPLATRPAAMAYDLATAIRAALAAAPVLDERAIDEERLAELLTVNGWTPPPDEAVFGRYTDDRKQYLSKVAALAAAYRATPPSTEPTDGKS